MTKLLLFCVLISACQLGNKQPITKTISTKSKQQSTSSKAKQTPKSAIKILTPNTRIIAVQPIIPFSASTTQMVIDGIRKFYECQTILLLPIDLPANHYTFIKGKRIFADSALRFLKNHKADSINYILGFTSQDICTNKYDAFGNIKSPKAKYESFGIFGLGYQPGCANIISTHRLQTSNQSLFQQRVVNVALHEIGHNIGLPHCQTPHCFMQDAEEKISTLDEENIMLCDACKKKLNNK